MNDLVLSNIDQARRMLAEAKSVGEVKDVRDKAAAIERYLRQKDGAGEAAVSAGELKLRAERRLGELLAADGERRGGKSKLNDETSIRGGCSNPLPDGITKTQSHRFQKVASVPAPVFERELAKAKEQQDPPTTQGMIRVAKMEEKKSRPERAVPSKPSTVKDLGRLAVSGEKFGTIYVDPPWQYGNQGTRAATDNHYSTMSVDDVVRFAADFIAPLAAEESHLHLWTTNAFLFDCPRIFAAAGFDYKSLFLWVKPQLGIGNYWRVSHEIMLLGVKGGLVFPPTNIPSWLEAERTKHSAKPHQIRKLIEQVSPGPRIELFARNVAEGWVSWGNEIDRDLFDHDAREMHDEFV